MIRCALCHREYEADQSAQACASCVLLTQGCGKVKCPYCGYENQRPLKDAFTSTYARWKEILSGPRR